MKFSSAVSQTAEEYLEAAEHEGGDALVTDPGTMKQVLDDFALYCKYTKDSDVHDELTPDHVGTVRLHILTEEEYLTVCDFMAEWGPDYITGVVELWPKSTDPTRLEEVDAMVEALVKLNKRMEEDRVPND